MSIEGGQGREHGKDQSGLEKIVNELYTIEERRPLGGAKKISDDNLAYTDLTQELALKIAEQFYVAPVTELTKENFDLVRKLLIVKGAYFGAANSLEDLGRLSVLGQRLLSVVQTFIERKEGLPRNSGKLSVYMSNTDRLGDGDIVVCSVLAPISLALNNGHYDGERITYTIHPDLTIETKTEVLAHEKNKKKQGGGEAEIKNERAGS